MTELRPDPLLARMSPPRDRSTSVAACYGALAIAHVAAIAGLAVWRQNGVPEALWWELTRSSNSPFYAVLGGLAVLQGLLGALAFRFARRPRAVRVMVALGAVALFVDSFLGPLLAVLATAGIYRPSSHGLQAVLVRPPPPVVVVGKFLLCVTYWFCAYQLIRLHRSIQDRSERL